MFNACIALQDLQAFGFIEWLLFIWLGWIKVLLKFIYVIKLVQYLFFFAD